MQSGLSPLARGTSPGKYIVHQPRRFIPAGAGNMTAGGGVYGAQPVYPRWRGEHMYMLNAALEPAGLSPLARGT